VTAVYPAVGGFNLLLVFASTVILAFGFLEIHEKDSHLLLEDVEVSNQGHFFEEVFGLRT
jgi:hypothetical protein